MVDSVTLVAFVCTFLLVLLVSGPAAISFSQNVAASVFRRKSGVVGSGSEEGVRAHVKLDKASCMRRKACRYQRGADSLVAVEAGKPGDIIRAHAFETRSAVYVHQNVTNLLCQGGMDNVFVETGEKQYQEQQGTGLSDLDMWKASFQIKEDGTVKADIAQESQDLLADFIDHIVHKKALVLEELAEEFRLRTQDTVRCIQELEAVRRITGVMDDRGKFIFVSLREMENVSAFIQSGGRTSISALVDKSSAFVKA